MGSFFEGAKGFFGIPAKDVADFHNNSDADSGNQAQHHTLGSDAFQAAPGNHKHKGKRIVTWQGTGPWSAAVPGPTTGSPVVIDIPGNYHISMQASGYSTVAGVTNWELWVDGFNLQGAPFYHNQINTHVTGPRVARDNFPLAKGTHYVYIRHLNGGAASDVNDWGIVELWLSEET